MFVDIILTLLLFIAIPIIAWYIYYYNWKWKMEGLKGPTPIPILGSALEFKGRKTMLSDMLSLLERFGKVVPLMVGIEPYVIVADYEVLEKILSSTQFVEKSRYYRFFAKWLNSGLLLSVGAKWKKRRRILTPTYHFQILEQFIPVIEQVSDILVDQLRQNQNLDAVDIYPYIRLGTLDVISSTAMGVEINALLNKHSEYVTSVHEMGKIVVDRSLRPLEQSNWTYWMTKNYRTEQRCLKVIHNHTRAVIAKRRKELERKIVNKVSDEDDCGTKKRVAFLDLLLNASVNGVPLTDEDIQEEVDTFMFEGHDTTASGLSFALYSIAHHADVQAKILAEQEAIFGEDRREVTLNDLTQMRYLEMVIKETLRLYPPVPVIGRQHGENIEIGNGMKIPANTSVSLIIYQIQRDPSFFANPEKFDPDRFLADNNVGKLPYCYIPFSAGPRNCIGQRFAFLEMKTVISKIIRCFELSPTVPAHTLDLTTDTILKSDNGIIIKIRERK